jgi:hypothetical protein
MINWVSLAVPPLIGAAIGFFVWYFQSRIDQLRRAQERLHDDRRQIYSRMLEPYIRLFSGLNDPGETQTAMSQILSFD